MTTDRFELSRTSRGILWEHWKVPHFWAPPLSGSRPFSSFIPSPSPGRIHHHFCPHCLRPCMQCDRFCFNTPGASIKSAAQLGEEDAFPSIPLVFFMRFLRLSPFSSFMSILRVWLVGCAFASKIQRTYARQMSQMTTNCRASSEMAVPPTVGSKPHVNATCAPRRASSRAPGREHTDAENTSPIG